MGSGQHGAKVPNPARAGRSGISNCGDSGEFVAKLLNCMDSGQFAAKVLNWPSPGQAGTNAPNWGPN